MPDNPEFTAAQVFDAAKVYVKDHPTAAAMLRALATRLRAEEKPQTLGSVMAEFNAMLRDAGSDWKIEQVGPSVIGAVRKPAPDAGTGPLKIPDVIAPGTFMERGGYRQAKPVDAGTGEARTTVAGTLPITIASGMMTDPKMVAAALAGAQPPIAQPPAPAPDLAEMLTDEAV